MLAGTVCDIWCAFVIWAMLLSLPYFFLLRWPFVCNVIRINTCTWSRLGVPPGVASSESLLLQMSGNLWKTSCYLLEMLPHNFYDMPSELAWSMIWVWHFRTLKSSSHTSALILEEVSDIISMLWKEVDNVDCQFPVRCCFSSMPTFQSALPCGIWNVIFWSAQLVCERRPLHCLCSWPDCVCDRETIWHLRLESDHLLLHLACWVPLFDSLSAHSVLVQSSLRLSCMACVHVKALPQFRICSISLPRLHATNIDYGWVTQDVRTHNCSTVAVRLSFSVVWLCHW